MQRTFFLFAISFLIFSCGDQSLQEKSTDTPNQQSSTDPDPSNIGRTNFAVVWNWTTTNADLVTDNAPTVSKELSELWENGVVENAYYDTNAPTDKLGHFPNIVFFLKAHSMVDAESILNELTITKKGIATYRLYPVGNLWLDRKSDVINKKGVGNSYVAIWTTLKSPLQGTNADVLLKEQSDKVLELWNKGVLENVYFDIEGTYEANNKTGFVFFVNANTQEEAETICNSLPMYEKGVATYKMLQSGVFWMGKSQSK